MQGSVSAPRHTHLTNYINHYHFMGAGSIAGPGKPLGVVCQPQAGTVPVHRDELTAA